MTDFEALLVSGTVLGIVAFAWTWARRSLGIATPAPALEALTLALSVVCWVLGAVGVDVSPDLVDALVVGNGLAMVLVVVALAVGHWHRVRSL